ncbi:hypothetical protein B566_EDAN018986 [Ephemera danica]|nr:hypothetical protein B566_EDAN018986 [Ephemera danica]
MLLSIQNLRVAFRMGKEDGVQRYAQAVGRDAAGVSFDIPENSTVALVGESGSGKSVTAMSIVNLLPDNAQRQGQVLYQGQDLLQADAATLRTLRGKEIACVFQDPMSSLNPVFTGVFGKREFKAVSNVSFELKRGHTLGVVGESGSGKTTMGLTLLRLHEPTAGEVIFDGQNLLTLTDEQRQVMRRRIQIVFQNPYASLNPRFTIAQTLMEPMTIHGIGASDAERQARARDLLRKVGLDESALGKYPHEFSGGQRQRVAIARCLTLNPEVLVLDEAVSALDVSVQAQVLNLLRDLQDELGLAYVFISHDLAVVRFISDEVLVMKDGVVVERAAAHELMDSPKQDYTRRLLGAIPRGYQPSASQT